MTKNNAKLMIRPLDLAFESGNFVRARALANALLNDSKSTPEVLEIAKNRLLRMRNDPYVLWIGIATLVFALSVSWMVLH